jgi:hypothetical protein
MYHNHLTDDENDDFELRSWNSVKHTFITEPKFEKVVKATKPPLGYKDGDFINRNKLLGPDARFYHAMSAQEHQRVNSLLEENVALDSEDSSLRAFTPRETELQKLSELDVKLGEIYPPEDWKDRSIIWSPFASVAQTPVAIQPKSVDQVLTGFANNSKMFETEAPLLDRIDNVLAQLAEKPREIPQSEIQTLLESLRNEMNNNYNVMANIE